jgi:predicted amidohydrolase
MKTIVCAAQMRVDHLDVDENMNRARALLNEAVGKKCDFICFPELFLTGPTGEVSHVYADEIPGKYTDVFCSLAEKNNIHIIMGSIVEREGDVFYNTTVVIDDFGKILGKYRKINLWNGEYENITPGDNTAVFETRFGKIGLEICWDLAFPETAMELTRKGAEIIFCPSYWTHQDIYDIDNSEDIGIEVAGVKTELNFINACVPSRAFENAIIYVYANACGETKIGSELRNLVGYSQIAIPFHGRIGLIEDDEGLLIKEVDLNLNNLAKRAYNIIR